MEAIFLRPDYLILEDCVDTTFGMLLNYMTLPRLPQIDLSEALHWPHPSHLSKLLIITFTRNKGHRLMTDIMAPRILLIGKIISLISRQNPLPVLLKIKIQLVGICHMIYAAHRKNATLYLG